MWGGVATAPLNLVNGGATHLPQHLNKDGKATNHFHFLRHDALAWYLKYIKYQESQYIMLYPKCLKLITDSNLNITTDY